VKTCFRWLRKCLPFAGWYDNLEPKSSVVVVISALGRLRREDGELKASLGYIARSVKKKKIGQLEIMSWCCQFTSN
jgi:hypothetical protein